MAKDRKYRIALAQLPIRDDDLRANARQIIRAIEWAGDRKADFVVTPESSLTGHHNRFDKSLRDRLVREIRHEVERAGVVAIVGSCDKRRGKSYIEQLIIGEEGQLLGRQTKIVLASIDRSWATPGRRIPVYKHRGLDFGCLVCNDLWVVPLSGARNDPRLTLKLAERGARVIFCSSYSGSDQRFRHMHESNVMLRAMEGQLYIVAVNATAAGPVNAVTGIMGPDGHWVIQCPRRGRQLAMAEITVPRSLAKLRALEEPDLIYVRRRRARTKAAT